MAAMGVRGLTAVLVVLLSVLHARAWVTPGLVRQSSFVSQARESDKKWSWCNLRASTKFGPAGRATATWVPFFCVTRLLFVCKILLNVCRLWLSAP